MTEEDFARSVTLLYASSCVWKASNITNELELGCSGHWSNAQHDRGLTLALVVRRA